MTKPLNSGALPPTPCSRLRVADLDARFGDAAGKWQPHEKYREIRTLALHLEDYLRWRDAAVELPEADYEVVAERESGERIVARCDRSWKQPHWRDHFGQIRGKIRRWIPIPPENVEARNGERQPTSTDPKNHG